MKTIAEKYAGTSIRYTPPKCCDERHNGEGGRVDQVCSHAESFHTPSGESRPEGGSVNLPFGLRRDKNGASFWPREDYTKQRAIPPRTRESIAACAALGLSYWSEAPGINRLWAIDGQQEAHEVRIDRKNGKVEGYDVRIGPGLGCRREAFFTPSTEETLALF
jgi:hypothetical protein